MSTFQGNGQNLNVHVCVAAGQMLSQYIVCDFTSTTAWRKCCWKLWRREFHPTFATMYLHKRGIENLRNLCLVVIYMLQFSVETYDVWINILYVFIVLVVNHLTGVQLERVFSWLKTTKLFCFSRDHSVYVWKLLHEKISLSYAMVIWSHVQKFTLKSLVGIKW